MTEREHRAPATVGRATDNVRYWVAEALSYEFLPRVQNLVETIETRAAERNRPPVEIARSLAEESRRAAGRRETAERVMERVFPARRPQGGLVSEWHGWRVSTRQSALHIGKLPGRKNPVLFEQRGSTVTTLASFRDEEAARRALDLLDALAEAAEAGELMGDAQRGGYLLVHMSDLEKAAAALRGAETYLRRMNEMNAALHRAAPVYSPLTTQVAAEAGRMEALIASDGAQTVKETEDAD